MAQGALERLVGQRLAQQGAGIDHQVAAVGPQQRAALDQAVVGDQGAELRLLLDAAEQVVVGGVGLDHHRRARLAAVVHHHVDAIVLEQRFGWAEQQGGGVGLFFLGVSARLVLLHVLRDVLAHRSQVLDHLVPCGVVELAARRSRDRWWPRRSRGPGSAGGWPLRRSGLSARAATSPSPCAVPAPWPGRLSAASIGSCSNCSGVAALPSIRGAKSSPMGICTMAKPRSRAKASMLFQHLLPPLLQLLHHLLAMLLVVLALEGLGKLFLQHSEQRVEAVTQLTGRRPAAGAAPAARRAARSC